MLVGGSTDDVESVQRKGQTFHVATREARRHQVRTNNEDVKKHDIHELWSSGGTIQPTYTPGWQLSLNFGDSMPIKNRVRKRL